MFPEQRCPLSEGHSWFGGFEVLVLRSAAVATRSLASVFATLYFWIRLFFKKIYTRPFFSIFCSGLWSLNHQGFTTVVFKPPWSKYPQHLVLKPLESYDWSFLNRLPTSGFNNKYILCPIPSNLFLLFCPYNLPYQPKITRGHPIRRTMSKEQGYGSEPRKGHEGNVFA